MGEQPVVRRSIIAVEVDVEKWRADHGDEDRDYGDVVDDIDYAWTQTSVPDAIKRTTEWHRYAKVTEDPDAGPRNRRDEAGFRRGVPRYIGLLEIVAVGGFTAGSDEGAYAKAIALTRQEASATQPWATHTIFHQDDRPDSEWLLHAGHYRSEEADARADFAARTT